MNREDTSILVLFLFLFWLVVIIAVFKELPDVRIKRKKDKELVRYDKEMEYERELKQEEGVKVKLDIKKLGDKFFPERK